MSPSFEISARAKASLISGTNIEIEDKAAQYPPYDAITRLNDLTTLAGATQSLGDDMLKERMDKFAKAYSSPTAYGAFTGTRELQNAVAGFVNNHFHPATQVISFNLCDPGDGVMIMTPTYMMFPHNLCTRAGLKLVTVPTDDSSDPDFDADVESSVSKVVEKLEAVYLTAQKSTLVAIARFCARHGMHLVADEINAMSSFPSPDGELDTFSSVLAIANDPSKNVFKENIHVVYGASKDWACGGLRLGFLITRNPLLWRTCRRLALSTWKTIFSTVFFTHLLSNEKTVDEYIDQYQLRLKESYVKVSALLRGNGVPFKPANSCDDLSQRCVYHVVFT